MINQPNKFCPSIAGKKNKPLQYQLCLKKLVVWILPESVVHFSYDIIEFQGITGSLQSYIQKSGAQMHLCLWTRSGVKLEKT